MGKYDDVLAIGARGFSEIKRITVSTNVIYTHYPIHNHYFTELEYIYKGAGTTVVNGKRYTFGDRTLCLCTNTDFHEFFPERECVILSVGIKTDYVNPELLIHLSDAIVINDYDNVIMDKINYEYKLILDNKPDVYLKHLINGTLIDCIRRTKPHGNIDLYSKFSAPIGKALQIIHSRFSESLNLEDVAKAVELSPNYFSTKFHNEVNQTFQGYLLDLRLEAARKYLIATNCSVTDLCFFTGFNNYVNFSKAFKKKYNITPTQCRINNQNNTP